MYQDNRKNSKHKGFWYARAVSSDVVGIKELALRISNRCTVTEPDILAVISALHRRIKTLISGLRIQEAVKYDAPEKGKAKEPGKEPGKDQKPGGNTPSGGPQAGDTTGGDEAGTHPQG